MTRAYDEQYLDDAMHNLGEAFDFACHVCQVKLDDFLAMMLSSGIARHFERGNPKYVSGMSGTELALEVLERTGLHIAHADARTEYACSPEYWAGWIIAYFQWLTGRTFQSIQEALSMTEVLRLYPTLHETSDDRAVDGLRHVIRQKALPVRLQRRRKCCGLTQRELSRKSGVNLRTLQQYERRAKDINKASGNTLRSLALTLSCTIEELLEFD